MATRRWEEVLAESRRIRTGAPPTTEQCAENKKDIEQFIPTELTTQGSGFMVATAEACGMPQATIQRAMPRIVREIMPTRRWEDVLAGSRRIRAASPATPKQCIRAKKLIDYFIPST